jgi:hypothetical protein
VVFGLTPTVFFCAAILNLLFVASHHFANLQVAPGEHPPVRLELLRGVPHDPSVAKVNRVELHQ